MKQNLKEYQNAQRTLEVIRCELGSSHVEWAGFLGLTAAQYDGTYLGDPSKIQLETLKRATDALGLLPEHIFGHYEIDHKTVTHRLKGDSEYLPEKYTTAAFSRGRSLLQMLKYLEDTRGPAHSWLALRRFQLNESSVQDPNTAINVTFFEDFFGYLYKQFGFRRNDFSTMGAFAQENNKKTAYAIELSASRSPKEVFERLCGDLQELYDKNFTYEIENLSNSSIQVICRQKKDVADALHKKILGSRFLCLWKLGIFNSTPSLLDLPRAQAGETHCIHHGDDACRFIIHFDVAYDAFKQRQQYAGIIALT